MKNKLGMVVIAALLLAAFAIGACHCEETGLYLDSKFIDGIYFQIGHPDSPGTTFAGSQGIGPLNIHRWKKITVSAVFRYMVNDKINSVSLSNSNWSTSDSSIAAINVKNHGTCEVTTISPGTAVIKVSYKFRGKTYTGRVTFTVRKLIVENATTLRYAALSDISYYDLTAYKDKSIMEVLRPKYAEGRIEADIGVGKSILNSDTYHVYADARDYIAECAGDCIIRQVYKEDNFQGVLFSWGSQYIMAFRGTVPGGNYLTDARLGLGLAAEGEFASALKFYNLYSSCSPILTGHSLGGGLANYVSVLTGAKAYTFNAPSTVVTGISNFMARKESGLFGRNYRGLNANLYTDFVNNSDWVGKVGPGDSKDGIFTAGSSRYESGNIDTTVFLAPVKGNKSEPPIPLGPVSMLGNDHAVLRMVYYNSAHETIALSTQTNGTNPKQHNFTWSVNRAHYYLGSVSSDSVKISSQLNGQTAVVFSGNGSDTIRLTGYTEERIIPGKGNDIIRSCTNSGGAGSNESLYYYYDGHGYDTIYDYAGTDSLYVFGCSGLAIENSHNGVFYVIDNSTHKRIIELHVGYGTGSFTVYYDYDEIVDQPIMRERNTITTDTACPVRLHIYDGSNNLVETVQDGKLYDGCGDYGFFSTYETEDGYGKSVTLTSEDYHIVIEGTGEGTMKYSTYYTRGEETKTKAVSRISVHDGSLYYPAAFDDSFLILADLNGDGIIDYQPMSDEITSLRLPETLTLYFGSASQLTPSWMPSDREADLVWSSSNPDVVSVDDFGNLIPVGTGDAIITVAALNGSCLTASCAVTVPDENFSIEDAVVTGAESRIEYTGEPYHPELTVSFRGVTLLEGKAFYVEYSDEYLPGTASIIIHGLEPFQGTKSIGYEIYQFVPATTEEAVDNIIQEMNRAGVSGEYNKAVWLHNWLIYHANYDYTHTYYFADGVLLHQSGVCQSYALAYQLLLNKVGITNQLVSSSEMDHAWNLVKLEGAWCHVDCTWDDPNEGGFENYLYFGMNDDMMGRDHRWNRDRYPAATTTANYYLLRDGYTAFSSAEEMETILVSIAENQQTTVKICYVGTESTFDVPGAFEDWFHTVNWKYGMRSFDAGYNQYYAFLEITYTDPWGEPDTKLDGSADAPAFKFNGPRGVFQLSDYANNGLILVFGRDGCLNTSGFIDRLRFELPSLNSNGIEVIISIRDAFSIEDILHMEEQYPGFNYVYDQNAKMWEYLRAAGCELDLIYFPAVFIINSAGKIIYYSTGYVSNMDELISEAFSTATGNALPVPGEMDYDEIRNGSGNIDNLEGSTIVSAIQNAHQDGSSVIVVTGYYINDAYLTNWEKNYSFYSSLGIKLVATFRVVEDDEKTPYPHVIFADYDNEDFWNLLYMVNFSERASYTGTYLFGADGSCISYANGDMLYPNDCAVLVCDDMNYDFVIPWALTVINEEAFDGGAFRNADLTAGNLSTIESLAFANNLHLRIVRIPNSVHYIAEDAFRGCENVIFFCQGNSYACQYAIQNGITYLIK